MTGTKEAYRVLIIDDERIVADTMTIIFSKSGYLAKAVYTVAEAMAAMAEWRPHLAIVDVHLAGASGIELAIQVRAEYPKCKLTLFSGMGSSGELLEAARQNGHAFDVLAKPVPPAEMLQMASRMLEGAGEG